MNDPTIFARRAYSRFTGDNWTPYYPQGYPLRDGIHNPWVSIDPISGLTGYKLWVSMGRTTDPEAFKAALESEKAH